MPLITATGSYDRSAIMRRALDLVSHHAKLNPTASRAALLRHWLRDVWFEAHRAYDRRHFSMHGNAAMEAFFGELTAVFHPEHAGA